MRASVDVFKPLWSCKWWFHYSQVMENSQMKKKSSLTRDLWNVLFQLVFDSGVEIRCWKLFYMLLMSWKFFFFGSFTLCIGQILLRVYPHNLETEVPEEWKCNWTGEVQHDSSPKFANFVLLAHLLPTTKERILCKSSVYVSICFPSLLQILIVKVLQCIYS